MASHFELQPLIQPKQTAERRLAIARAAQNLMYLDLCRVGATENEARSVADPEDDGKVDNQLRKMINPAPRGTHYEGGWEDDELVAFVKRGPMFHGDLEDYSDEPLTVAQKLGERLRPDHGLHGFAVARQELARVTLAHVVAVTPAKKKLYVEAHVNDDWLNDALDEMDIPSDGPVAEKTFGLYTARSRLRTIPPRT